MLQGMINLPEMLKSKYCAFKYNKYMRSRQVVCTAPYNSGVYHELLWKISKLSNMKFIPFLENGYGSEAVNVFVRHDIDTSRCIEKMALLLDIDKSVETPAAIYFRADNKEYSLKNYKDAINRYRDAGFEIGLHTVCYTKDNYLEEFAVETEKFSNDVGFRPKSFSVHGLGTFRQDIRIQFYEYISSHLNEFGYEFGDIPQLRAYDYVIQDCHMDARNNRFIYDDFMNPPSFLKKGKNCLILTHPCYWVP